MNDSLILVIFIILVSIVIIIEYLRREYWLPRKDDRGG